MQMNVLIFYVTFENYQPFKTVRCTRWHSWLRHCATSRKVAGSILDGVFGIFHWHKPSGRTMALEFTQPLTEMTTRNIDMDMSYTRVLHVHIKVAYRVPHKMMSRLLRHTVAAMRAHNVLCNSYNSRDKPLQLSSCTFCFVVHSYSFENCIAYFHSSKLVYHGTPNTHRCTTHRW
jgi:hypothetical protein